MNEHNKLVSGVEAMANPAPSTGRRRLVKGAMLATPAILTLHGGLAWAVSCTDIIRTEGGGYVVYVDIEDENGNFISTAVLADKDMKPIKEGDNYIVVLESQMRCGSNFASLTPG